MLKIIVRSFGEKNVNVNKFRNAFLPNVKLKSQFALMKKKLFTKAATVYKT